MDGGDHMEIPQSENLISEPENIDHSSSLPSTSLVLLEIARDRDEASSEMESCSPTSSSAVLVDIAGTKDEQSPKILESSLSTVQTEIIESNSGILELSLAPGSALPKGDERDEIVEPSRLTSSSGNSKTNPFMEDLLIKYPNNVLIPEEIIHDVIVPEKKKVVDGKMEYLEKLKKQLEVILGKIPRILAQADDMKEAKEKVESLFQLSDTIDFFIKKRLPKKHPTREKQEDLEAARKAIPRIDIYCQLFEHALKDSKRKHSEVPAFKEKGNGGDPLQYYESTNFMVFLINKVQGEEDIMTTSLVPSESTNESKTLITRCVESYVKETLGICICLVIKGLDGEAEGLFKDIIVKLYIKSGDIISHGRAYNYALQKAEELFEVHKFLSSERLSQRYKHDVETRDLLNWIDMDQRHNQDNVHKFFVNLFLNDGELMQQKDKLTFAWMEQNDYPYLIKCVCECHQLLQRCSLMDEPDKLKVCRELVDNTQDLKVCRGLVDGTQDNWKEVQVYVEYALHSCAMSAVAGVHIIGKLFEIWPKLDINASYKGVTAFHVAAYKGHEEVVKVLLCQKDFDANVRTGRFITVESLQKVFAKGDPKVDAKALSRGIISYEGEMTSACKDYEEVIKDLIHHGEIKITPNDHPTIAELGTTNFFLRAAYSGKKWNRNRWKISTHQTALHIATKQGHASVVKLLCDKTHQMTMHQLTMHQMTMRYHEEDEEECTALDIIYEKLSACQKDSDDYAPISEIEKTLLNVDDVQKGIDRLYRYRQVLVDAANTILVGAALIASVTFAGWLQPPLGYAQYYDLPTPPSAPSGTYDSYIGVQGNVGIQVFALFNSLSFFFAIATVIVGADAAFPMRKSEYIGEVITTMERLLQRAIKFLIISLACVLGAFGSAAVIILPPHVYFRKHLVLTILIGGGVCGVALWQLLSRHSKKVQVLNAMIVSFIAKYTYIFKIDKKNSRIY